MSRGITPPELKRAGIAHFALGRLAAEEPRPSSSHGLKPVVALGDSVFTKFQP